MVHLICSWIGAHKVIMHKNVLGSCSASVQMLSMNPLLADSSASSSHQCSPSRSTCSSNFALLMIRSAHDWTTLLYHVHTTRPESAPSLKISKSLFFFTADESLEERCKKMTSHVKSPGWIQWSGRANYRRNVVCGWQIIAWKEAKINQDGGHR
jgi:hypothetical protein